MAFLSVHPEQDWPLAFFYLLVILRAAEDLLLALASEIGPGLSPDIPSPPESGLQPQGYALPNRAQNTMKKPTKPDPIAPRPNLDFSKGTRGKYANLIKQGSNLVILDPALMPFFPDSASVNRALHAFLAINDQVQSAATRVRGRRRPAASASVEFDPRVGTASR